MRRGGGRGKTHSVLQIMVLHADDDDGDDDDGDVNDDDFPFSDLSAGGGGSLAGPAGLVSYNF